MRSPALAIVWQIGRRHRWGLAAVGSYLALLAVVRLLVVATGERVTYADGMSFPLVVLVPLSATVMYVLAVFSFGLAGDLAARRSPYPARMFTLPVTDAALVAWPMLCGAGALTVLWVATRSLAVWPAGVHVPLVWPALAGAVLLGWTEVLTWMPYPLRGLRVAATVLWLSLFGLGLVFALELRVTEGVMLAGLALQLPLVYVAARFVVSHARHDAPPDWHAVLARGRPGANSLGRRDADFATPGRAQAWLEWRRHGRALPILVSMVLPFELALLWVFRDLRTLAIETLLLVLLTPPFLGACAAATVAKSGPHGSDAYELTPFLATRPLSSASLVSAKLRATIRSALVTWAVVATAVGIALWLSGTSSIVIEGARGLADSVGAPRAVAIVLLGIVALVVSTWKQLVRSLYIGMSGRPWLVKGSVFFVLSLLTLAAFLFPRALARERAFVALWRSLPWLLGALAAAKLLAAGWVATRLQARRLLSDRVLVGGAAAWLLAVSVLYGMLAWLTALPGSMPRHLLGLMAILVVPFVRLSAAPLALAWNRHRGAVAPERTGAARAGRPAVIGAVLLLIGLPIVTALAATISSHLDARATGTIVVDGQQRRYLLHVPESYDPAVAAPLVISLHGGAMWPAQQMHLSRWNALADENGFLVVYPSGIGFPRRWRTFDPGPGLEDDVRFIAALIDTLHAEYNIDPRRIYADGISNGGGMAFVLSCALAGRIAAVGAVAPAQSLPPEWCADSRPVPAILFHGDVDQWVPYDGGVMPDRIGPDPPVFPAVRDFVARWAERNRCAPVAADSEVAPEVTRLIYEDCVDGAVVTLYTIHGGGHTWPGGEPLPEWAVGATTRDVDATRRMWAFYREHPLPAR